MSRWMDACVHDCSGQPHTIFRCHGPRPVRPCTAGTPRIQCRVKRQRCRSQNKGREKKPWQTRRIRGDKFWLTIPPWRWRCRVPSRRRLCRLCVHAWQYGSMGHRRWPAMAIEALTCRRTFGAVSGDAPVHCHRPSGEQGLLLGTSTDAHV